MAEHCKISVACAAVKVAEQEERSYMLKVDRYSRVKGLLKKDECVTSAPFSAGGHSWAVKYYPNSHRWCVDFLVVLVLLDSAGAEDVNIKSTLSVLDNNGEPVPSLSHSSIHDFTSKVSGHLSFNWTDLEGSVLLTDDCLTIMCDITVMRETHSPPSDLHRPLGDLLLDNKDGADVTFQVNGQRFSAHRCVLAARSTVFKAELLGSMKENSGSLIEICDMEADVFESLLHFIYTDSLPLVLEGDSNKGAEAREDLVMAEHLLVAADRYNIGRLKNNCEKKLCNHINSDMVATSLALALQHGFHDLKEACLKFLASPLNLEAMMASNGFEHLKSSCPSILKELIVQIPPAELKVAKDLLMEIQ